MGFNSGFKGFKREEKSSRRSQINPFSTNGKKRSHHMGGNVALYV